MRATPNHELRTITEEEFGRDPERVMRDTDAGVPTAILGPDGEIRSVIGMSDERFLPTEPPLDPLLDFEEGE